MFCKTYLICVTKDLASLFLPANLGVLTSLSNSLSIMRLQTRLLGCELVLCVCSIRMVKSQPCIRTGRVLYIGNSLITDRWLATLETVLRENSLLERWGGWFCFWAAAASGQWCCSETPGRQGNSEMWQPCCPMVLLIYELLAWRLLLYGHHLRIGVRLLYCWERPKATEL